MPKKIAKKKVAKKKVSKKVAVESYRHESATRKNIPTAKIAAEGKVPRVPKAKYAYSAHLSPELRFDASGQSDRVTKIVEKAVAGDKLTKEEEDILRAVAANVSQPWLEWSGKREEHDWGVLEVEPVALHIHERVSANAIIRAAKREDVQADLFADPKQEYKEAIQFYRHDVDWSNRLILGDSLEIMSSLAKREDLAGRVQMLFIDPPYGINYKSNFQPNIKKTSVTDGPKDLTREQEMISAYRDTWHLGLHSYFSYLRDRFIVAHALLKDSGSIFVQISEANSHHVRELLDEIFGPKNFVAQIWFRKKLMPLGGKTLEGMGDYLLWFAKDKSQLKYHQLYVPTQPDPSGRWTGVKQPHGRLRRLDSEEKKNFSNIPAGGEIFGTVSQWAPSFSQNNEFEFEFEGKPFIPTPGQCWVTSKEKMERLGKANRLYVEGEYPRFVSPHSDFPYKKLTHPWVDTAPAPDKKYAVVTNPTVIERCISMTTDPSDLVVDPTCGSGTTAYSAEKLGRRWITIDTSRVAVAVARQRLLVSSFEFFELKDTSTGISAGLVNDEAPKVKLKTIAGNENLDPIFERYQPLLDQALIDCNDALRDVSSNFREVSRKNLEEKQKTFGKKSITDADLKRWNLPEQEFQHWTVPVDTDKGWPELLQAAVGEYSKVWADKMEAVNQCIADNSESQELFDAPKRVRSVLRVAGPFTVEGVRPEELSLDENGELFDPTPNEFDVNDGQGEYFTNASAYLDRMLQLMSQDGVTFPNNEHRKFALIEKLEEIDSALHAEALWEDTEDGYEPNIAIAFGPQHGPVTASQVEDLIRASRRYDELVIAAFSFDGSSQAVIQESANPRLKIHMAHIRPDVSPGMDGLLKDSPKSQLFTVFGQPEIKLHEEDGEIKVELLGVDIYSPLTGEITSSSANKVAAWFLDSDYDGRCFCITQAFFPNQKAWDKIAKALGSSADAEAFEAYNGTVSIPFQPGEYQRIAVKVIDPRGNEVMAIRSLKEAN